MSGFINAVQADPVKALQDVGFLSPTRQIGTIIPSCVVEEHGSDRLVITEHPVEQGAAISDHAYKLPAEVTVRYGFVKSLVNPQAFTQILQGNSPFGSFKEMEEVYADLLKMQESRVPFTLLTGKRIYQNMLIASLDQTTDQTTEYSLMIVIHCRQVIIVNTTTTQITAASKAQAPNVTPETNSGAKAPTPKPDSLLKQSSDYLLGH